MKFLDKLLNYYHLSTDQYNELTKNLSFEDLPNPKDYFDLSFIGNKIKKSISKGKKIIVYGDYDCDGVLATTILVNTFSLLGVQVGYYIPNRYQDGYGLPCEKVQQFAEKKYNLIITVDNGISAHEAINLANSLGLEVIITDHHEIRNELPKAIGILHPSYRVNFPSSLCGSFMALILSKELLGEYKPYFVTLASIATIADMMPLIGVNRNLVRLGLDFLKSNNFPSLSTLLENETVDEEVVAMKIVPSINAIGRMIENNSINRLVKFFTSTDIEEIQNLSLWIKQVNQSRKDAMNNAINQLPIIDKNEPGVIILTNEREGLIGLLANRLMNEFDKPVFVFTVDSSNPDFLIGSARTPSHISLLPIFDHLSPLLINKGGHANAGGLTISKNDFQALKELTFSFLRNEKSIKSENPNIQILLNEISWENYDLIHTFSPFGNGFKKPIFEIGNLSTRNLTYIQDGKTISTYISLDIKLLGFGKSKMEIEKEKQVNFSGFFKENVFRGKKELIFQITNYHF